MQSPLPIVLASASPRRRELLSLLGLPFRVITADVDESPLPDETPGDMVVRLSIAKAQAVAATLTEGWVIASDTTVVFEGEILGKPLDAAQAVDMLERMRGRPHTVLSGLVLWDAATGAYRSELSTTEVWMRDYTAAELDAYVSSGDPLDKAGAYGIQNAAFHPVARVDGCFASVMGFPLCHLYRLMRSLGIAPNQTPAEACIALTGHDCQVYGAILDHQIG